MQWSIVSLLCLYMERYSRKNASFFNTGLLLYRLVLSLSVDLVETYWTTPWDWSVHFSQDLLSLNSLTWERMIAKRTSRLFVRGVLLFLVGTFFALVLNLLQVQRQVTLYPDVIDTVFLSAWWLPPCCGTAAGLYFIYACLNFFIPELMAKSYKWKF